MDPWMKNFMPSPKRSALWGLTNYFPRRKLGKLFTNLFSFDSYYRVVILLFDYTTYYKIIKKILSILQFGHYHYWYYRC